MDAPLLSPVVSQLNSLNHVTPATPDRSVAPGESAGAGAGAGRGNAPSVWDVQPLAAPELAVLTREAGETRDSRLAFVQKYFNEVSAQLKQIQAFNEYHKLDLASTFTYSPFMITLNKVSQDLSAILIKLHSPEAGEASRDRSRSLVAPVNGRLAKLAPKMEAQAAVLTKLQERAGSTDWVVSSVHYALTERAKLAQFRDTLTESNTLRTLLGNVAKDEMYVSREVRRITQYVQGISGRENVAVQVNQIRDLLQKDIPKRLHGVSLEEYHKQVHPWICNVLCPVLEIENQIKQVFRAGHTNLSEEELIATERAKREERKGPPVAEAPQPVRTGATQAAAFTRQLVGKNATETAQISHDEAKRVTTLKQEINDAIERLKPLLHAKAHVTALQGALRKLEVSGAQAMVPARKVLQEAMQQVPPPPPAASAGAGAGASVGDSVGE